MKLPASLHELRRNLLPLAHAPLGPAGRRRAAVMILLYPRNGLITFALTVRPDTLSRHPGQISLPGGMLESNDATLWDTAVREIREELGMLPGRLMPLGRLGDVTVRLGNNIITPFVGWNPVPPRFNPDRNEVAEVVEVPLASLLQPDAIEEETWELRGDQWQVAFYRLGDHVVWGITGLILSDFHSRLEPALRSIRPGSVLPVV